MKLSDGEFVATRSLIWCVGVRPDPLIEQLGLPTTKGRLVDEYLTVPGIRSWLPAATPRPSLT